MDSRRVLEIYTALDRSGVAVWVDGGWCVSALVGYQIRPHGDLDIAVATRDVAALRECLGARGFREIPRADTAPWMFVLADADSNQVDVHAIDLDAEGRGILGPPEHGQFYPAGSLGGTGVIDGTPVRCISPDAMLKFKTSYVPRPVDRIDVEALCTRFGFSAPGHWP